MNMYVNSILTTIPLSKLIFFLKIPIGSVSSLLTSQARLLVSWYVCHNFLKGPEKLHFQCSPIGELVTQREATLVDN